VTVANPGNQTSIENGEVILLIMASDTATFTRFYSAPGLSISSSGQISGAPTTPGGL
jgi:hypothetical protein